MQKTNAKELALLVRQAHRRITDQRIENHFSRSAWEQAYEPVRLDYWLTLMENVTGTVAS